MYQAMYKELKENVLLFSVRYIESYHDCNNLKQLS